MNHDDFEDQATFEPPKDPIDEALGAPGHLQNAVVTDCVETFQEGRFMLPPEVFDRQYWQPRLLVDVIDADEEQEAREAKRVDFKRRWCAEHDRLYLVLDADEAGDVAAIRAAYERLTEPAEPEPERRKPAAARRKPAGGEPEQPGRGKVQRPRARA